MKQLMKFKQKDEFIKKLAIEYKKIVFSSENKEDVICEGDNDFVLSNRNHDLSFKKRVDYILLHMDSNLSKVIFNEYFSLNIVNWWMYYFSKSTYYRMKNKAMNNFLEWWYV